MDRRDRGGQRQAAKFRGQSPDANEIVAAVMAARGQGCETNVKSSNSEGGGN
jgi:hypothetical protein